MYRRLIARIAALVVCAVICVVLFIVGLSTVGFWSAFFLCVAAILVFDPPLGAVAIVLNVVGSGLMLHFYPAARRPLSLQTLATVEGFVGAIDLLIWVLTWRLRRRLRDAARAAENALPAPGAAEPGPGHLYQRFLDLAPDGIVIVDSAGFVVFFSQQAEALFGYRREDILGEKVEMLLPEGLRERHVAHRAAYMAAPQTRPMGAGLDLVARRKDGSEFPVEVSLAPVDTEQGGRSGILIKAATRDVTRRKEIEARAEAARREAEEAQGRFRALLEAAPDAMVVLSEDGRVSFCSTQALRFFGYTQEEMAAFTIDALLPNGLTLLADRPAGFVRDLHARRKDGSLVEVEASLAPLRLGAGRLVTVALRDLGPRRALEAQRGRAEAAEAALAERDHFIGVVAHEIKTPMTSISGYAEMLQAQVASATADGAVDVRMGRMLAAIAAQTQKLQRLVDQLLDTTRLRAGRLILDRAESDVGAVVRAVAEAMDAGPVHGRAIRAPISVDLPPDPLRWDVDAARLEQVLRNLLDNARKFSPDGGDILVRARAEGGALVLSVSDHGIGVPPDRRPLLFTRFGQAHAASYRSGMGLGLFLSREIVEMHGGTIRAEFPSGGGARFVVEIPRQGPGDAGDT